MLNFTEYFTNINFRATFKAFVTHMENVYLLLGGNLGNRENNLQTAIALVAKKIGTVERQSLVYESSAWGNSHQPDFLNQVLVCKTSLSPHQVLREINLIEDKFDRVRTEKWGARTMDIDILFYGNLILKDNALTIPHPLLQERKFALTPLNQIVPDYVHPIFNSSMAQLYLRCTDVSRVWEYLAKQTI